MIETQRPSSEARGSGPAGLPDIFATPPDAGLATVSHGPYAEPLPVGGMSVAEVRRRFSDRMDIDPQSRAFLDGNEVSESTIVGCGQLLLFMRRAGEKGGCMPSILIKAGQASTVSPEGLRRSMRVGDLVRRAAPEMLDTGELVLPDGVKSVRSRGRVTILVHETPTRVWNLRWIAEDSPTHFGPGTKYRTVRIALPYIVVVATFQRVRGRLTLSKANECFFRTRPMTSLTEPGLCYPALLNCSRSVPDDGKSLAWLCTQYLERRAYETEADTNQRVRLALSELLRTLLGTSFNRSSEFHETNSWYAESVKRRVDPRIETIEKWEAATAEDPLFVLEVPWIPVERTLAEVIDRIFGNLSAREDRADSASDLARIIFNQPVQE